MKKEDVIDAIMYFGEQYHKKHTYQDILKTSELQEVVKMVILDMFLDGFDYQHSNIEIYKHYGYIKQYWDEINHYGAVEFENSIK